MREMKQGAKQDSERTKAEYNRKVALLQEAAGSNRPRR